MYKIHNKKNIMNIKFYRINNKMNITNKKINITGQFNLQREQIIRQCEQINYTQKNRKKA